MSTATSTRNQRTEGLQAFAYFANQILRQVVLAETVGHVHDGRGGLTSWSDKNGFNELFRLTTQQLSKIDLSKISHLEPDVVLAHNPFDGLQSDQIGDMLGVLAQAKSAVIAAIPTAEHYHKRPKVVYRVAQWRNILSQLGRVVEVYHCDYYSLFMIVRNG